MPDLNDNYKAEKTEEAKKDDQEQNTDDENGEENRPSGTRTMEDSTGVAIDDSKAIDEDMPTMPPA